MTKGERAVLCLLVTSILAIVIGCGDTSKNGNAQSSPSPTPTPTEEQKKQIAEGIEKAKLQAIEEYVSKNHKGWILSGISGGDYVKCESDSPCHLHLTQAGRGKVVAVVLRQFTKSDNSTYWYVYDTSPVDLARARLERLREQERDTTLENLTYDDCESVIEEEREIAYEPPDFDY